MKRITNLVAILFLLLIMASCGEKDDPTPTSETATFRVDYTQSGDYQKFRKILTITGGTFKVKGTDQPMPALLIDSHLSGAGPYSYEATDVRELDIKPLTGFKSVEEGPATMTMNFKIYRNGQLVQEKSFTYDENTEMVEEHIHIKAK